MKKSAKILSIILALVMILSAIPMAAFAADDDFVINGSGVLTAYNGAGGDIVIPDSAVAIPEEVFSGNSTITSVTMPNVVSISSSAFMDCTNLTSVIMPNVVSISSSAFMNCTNLESVIMPKVVFIDYYGFINCPNLESITVSDCIVAREGAFINCDSLTNVYCTCSSDVNLIKDALSSCGEYNYIKFEHNFVDGVCSVCGIKEFVINEYGVITAYNGAGGDVVIPAGPVSIGVNVFFENDTITSVVIPEGIDRIGDAAFGCCSNLVSVSFPDSLSSIADNAFSGCSSLKHITIPRAVTYIGETEFYGCTSLESVTMSDNVTTVGQWAFENCASLTTVFYPCSSDKNAIENLMKKFGDFTYTQLDHQFVAEYVDNNNGTHSQKCSECGQYLNPTNHTFVDDVCTFCGAEKAFKTIREILDTVPDFPTNEEDGWTNENGAKVYLTFEGIWQIVFPDMQSGVNNSVVKSGDNYYESYVPDTIYVMKDGVLDCIIVSRSVEGDLNGTYRPACKHPNAYTVPEKVVTCTEDGHSAYLYCPDCDEALEVYDVYVALNHAYAEDVDGKAATCTEDGLTDGKYCPDCNTWLVKPEVIPALNHKNAYTDNGEDETCSSSGFTPGVYCPDCDTYISGHEVIPPHPHSITDEYIDNEDGTHSQFCEECGEPIITKEHTFVDGVCVCGALEPVTILDVISTNKDFPTDIANAWLNEDGSTLIYKTDTNIILFATAAGDNTSHIGLNCEVKADGDNYIFNDFIFNMEDGVLKSVTMIDQYSSLKGTYAPHTHAYTDSYVDNGDGTHTGSCACGAVNPEKEEHTFVDGVCVCGATEPHIHIFDMAWTTSETAHWHSCFAEGCDITDYSTVENSYYALHKWEDGKCTVCEYECTHNGQTEGTCAICGKELTTPCEISGVKELTTPVLGEYVTLEITAVKPVKKLQFVDADGNTYTYSEASTHTLGVVDNDDGTQVWTVEIKVRENSEDFEILARTYENGWSDKSLSYTLDIDVVEFETSVEVPDLTSGMLEIGKHDVIIKTAADVTKVQFVYNGNTATYSKSSSSATVEEGDGCLIWTISKNFCSKDDGTFTIKTRTASTGFEDTGASFSAEVVKELKPR